MKVSGHLYLMMMAVFVSVLFEIFAIHMVTHHRQDVKQASCPVVPVMHFTITDAIRDIDAWLSRLSNPEHVPFTDQALYHGIH